MNKRQQAKEQSRKNILIAAGKLFRQQGLQATGIDQIMEKAGLTAGAFYNHFESKDHLIEEVLWSTFEERKTWDTKSFLSFYLNPMHRDRPAIGCPLATLGSDLGRATQPLKRRISKRLSHTIKERLMSPSPEVKKKALKTLSLAVGALILSRITQGSDLSDEFLNCYR